MSKKAAPRQVVFKVDDMDKLREKMDPEQNKRLLCLDVHRSWCGPTTCIEPNFRALFFSDKFENCEQRAEFLTADETVCPPELLADLKYGALTCKPRFIIWVEGEKKEEIDGADFTTIEAALTKWVPSLDD